MRNIFGLTLVICVAIACAQAQKTFDTPEAAAQDLIEAASTNNLTELHAIFGPEANTILTSGNVEQDEREREEFSRIAQEKHELQRDAMNTERMILSVGNEDWPFPAPIVRKDGKWSFDTSMGALLMRARRIGANELDAIEICAGYVTAQHEYALRGADRHSGLQYARRIMSSSGHHDGLYWGDAPGSLVPEGLAEAALDAPAAKLKPYHGYYFRVLSSQGPNAPGGQQNYIVKDSMIGGFGLVAWPAKYGVTGIRTFLVNQDGVIYEKDLGNPASNLKPPVASYDPDSSWKPVN